MPVFTAIQLFLSQPIESFVTLLFRWWLIAVSVEWFWFPSLSFSWSCYQSFQLIHKLHPNINFLKPTKKTPDFLSACFSSPVFPICFCPKFACFTFSIVLSCAPHSSVLNIKLPFVWQFVFRLYAVKDFALDHYCFWLLFALIIRFQTDENLAKIMLVYESRNCIEWGRNEREKDKCGPKRKFTIPNIENNYDQKRKNQGSQCALQKEGVTKKDFIVFEKGHDRDSLCLYFLQNNEIVFPY